MARRRLTPARTDLALPEARPPAPAAAAALIGAPIARVAGEAAATAALHEVSAELAAARSEGRLVLRLPLAAVETGWLMRDRAGIDEEDLAPLLASLAAHGQRTPVEVAEIGPGRYGLISGWRRMTALARLRAETGEARFGEVLALLRRPEGAGAAYVAMVEENEIRLGLSHYERARIVARAAEGGVFETDRAALQALFAAASRARRSKIGSFLAIVRALDPVLRFPAAIPERLGLALARWIETAPAAAARLAAELAADPAPDAAAELARLAAALRPGAAAGPSPGPSPGAAAGPGTEDGTAPGGGTGDEARTEGAVELRPGLWLRAEGGFLRPRLTLWGPALDPGLRERLEHWLRDGG
ncbi:MAG TPA: ParB N-terminal domain-containing protein [Paracoccaceae bacterium]|nr:ParB N-terminal domain-containing protein [Paracoccaceae bacterium]